MTVVALVALALLGSAAAIVLVGLFRGPTNLDRIVAAEILMVIVVAGGVRPPRQSSGSRRPRRSVAPGCGERTRSPPHLLGQH